MSLFSYSRMVVCIALSVSALTVGAQSLEALSNREANAGLKAALEKGASMAVSKLGVENGFLNNEKVKIQLPGILEKAQPLLKMTGKGKQLDELVLSMNHAAESAVPLAKPLLINAIKSMSVTDAKNILTGGDTSVTQFFKAKTADSLAQKFMPVVKKVTDRTHVSAQYNGVMKQVSQLGVVPEKEASVESYVTQRALEGLYFMIGEEEKAIRQDPIGTGSALIGKVFNALK